MKKNSLMAKSTALLLLIVLIASFALAINFSALGSVGPSALASDQLVINEFIVQPEPSESIELYNPNTTHSVNLAGFILSDRPLFSDYWPAGEGNMTLSGTIAADDYKVITTLWDINVLGNEGDDLYLYDNSTGDIVDAASALNKLVDSIAYGPQGGCPEPEYGWSACRAPNGIDTDDDAADWNLNFTSGPTMGSANDAPPAALCEGPVVINEVLANPSDPMPEFIELYNKGIKPVNVTGWYISDGDDLMILPSLPNITGGGWLVVNSTESWYSGVDLYFGLYYSEDNVYLFNSTGHRLDQMGWSSNHGGGTSVARFSDGVGLCWAYNDMTLVTCGWGEGATRNGSPGSGNNCTHIWITLSRRDELVRMWIRNDTVINATIANMGNNGIKSVNVTLGLPPGMINTSLPLTRKLGDLKPFNVTRVGWAVNVTQTGQHWFNLTVEAANETNPRTNWNYVWARLEVKIIIDGSHNQYYGPSRHRILIDYMQEITGVEENYGRITDELLEGKELLVLLQAQSDFIANETEVIKKFIDNGGSLMIMGTYYAHMEPEHPNNITLDYGIEFIDCETLDSNNNAEGNDYWPHIRNWTDNFIANYLSYNVTQVAAGRSCMLSLHEDVMPILLPIATGDTDPAPNQTQAKDPGGNVIAEGGDVLIFAVVETPGGGRIFASASQTVFTDPSPITDDYYINDPDGDNHQFAKNVIAWLMKQVGKPLVTDIEYEFNLTTLYKVGIEANLTVTWGSNLSARFWTYRGVYQASKTFWTGTPGGIKQNISVIVTHPLGLPVEIVTLMLSDEYGNWSTLGVTYVVSRSDLFDRATRIDNEWPGALDAQRRALFEELVAIDLQWPYAPP